MKKIITLIFPHQLFEDSPLLKNNDSISLFLIEEPRFFTEFNFHKQKLIFHRATMKTYQAFLEKKYNHTVHYIEYNDSDAFYKNIPEQAEIHYIDTIDFKLEKKLQTIANQKKATLIQEESPAFLSPKEWLLTTLKKQKKLKLYTFYIEQRVRLNILMEKNKKPKGGTWSYDSNNRNPLPSKFKIPPLPKYTKNNIIKESIAWVEKHFPKNPGSSTTSHYPVTHKDAKRWLKFFITDKLHNFGKYQDAINDKDHILYHSLLSPLLNVGLVTPTDIISEIHKSKKKIDLNNVEGFLRQIIGWREFIRGVYLIKGEKQRRSNFFNHKKKLPQSFWTATTGIEPLDSCIKEILSTGYVHHIERLMILGNFMLLAEYSPHEVYRWFMELFIDAYDWVMVPNVYGMSQYADGGLMSTKPYISSSNYIIKMSNYKKGAWSTLWDGLYWNFIIKNKKKLEKNNRMQLIYKKLNKNFIQTKKESIKEAKKIFKTVLKNK